MAGQQPEHGRLGALQKRRTGRRKSAGRAQKERRAGAPRVQMAAQEQEPGRRARSRSAVQVQQERRLGVDGAWDGRSRTL